MIKDRIEELYREGMELSEELRGLEVGGDHHSVRYLEATRRMSEVKGGIMELERLLEEKLNGEGLEG